MYVTLEVAEELLPHLSIVRKRLLLIILNLVLHALLLQHSVVSLRHELPLVRSEVRQGQRSTLLLPDSCNEVACAAKAWRSSTLSEKHLFFGGQQIVRALEGCIWGIFIGLLHLVLAKKANCLVEGISLFNSTSALFEPIDYCRCSAANCWEPNFLVRSLLRHAALILHIDTRVEVVSVDTQRCKINFRTLSLRVNLVCPNSSCVLSAPSWVYVTVLLALSNHRFDIEMFWWVWKSVLFGNSDLSGYIRRLEANFSSFGWCTYWLAPFRLRIDRVLKSSSKLMCFMQSTRRGVNTVVEVMVSVSREGSCLTEAGPTASLTMRWVGLSTRELAHRAYKQVFFHLLFSLVLFIFWRDWKTLLFERV